MVSAPPATSGCGRRCSRKCGATTRSSSASAATASSTTSRPPHRSNRLVKQMRGEDRVKSPRLQPLFEEARALVKQIGRVRFEHVRREFNKEADRLANEAMDAAAG